MSKREINLMPDTQQALAKMGANIRKARLRRNLNAEYIAEQGFDLQVVIIYGLEPFFMPCSMATGPCSQYIELINK